MRFFIILHFLFVSNIKKAYNYTKLSFWGGSYVKKIMSLLVLIFLLISTTNVVKAESEIDFEDLFDNHQSVMLIIHPVTGDIYYANQAAVEFYGYPKDQLIGMNIDNINMLTPEEVAAERQRAANEERNFFVFKHRLADGDIRTVHVYSYPVQIDGETYLYSFIIDQTVLAATEARNRLLVIGLISLISLGALITTTFMIVLWRKNLRVKNSELQLKRSETKYRTLIKQSSEGLFLHDLEGNIIEVNNSAIKQSGYSESELLSKNFFDLHPKDLNINMSKDTIIKLWKNWEIGEASKREAEHQRKDGSIYPVDLRLSKIVLEGKEYILTIVSDITERKSREQEIIHMSNHDYLTEIPNRRYYQEMLKKYDNEEYYPLGIIIMDMNGLKLINDAFEHSVGNEALKLCSNTLNETKRDKDFLARIGGDEFAIICPNIKVTEMEKLVDKIDKEVSKKSIKDIELSLAIGYEIKQDKKKSIRTTLTHAENYMYRSKVLTKHTDKNDMIQSILNTLTEKYNEEKVHSERVSKYCKAVGEAMQLRKDEITELELAGMVHDIGKISLPDAILKKPGKLTEKEWEIIRNHTVNGYQILRSADKYSNIAEFAMSHHERMDGKGYPNGLKGEEIPLFSRIISVADAYEAMTSDRPYRKAMKKQEAIEELKKHSGTQFDSGIVELFIDKVLAR